MIAIPNMDMPKNITRCSIKINPEECACVYTDKVFEETLALILDHPCDDCPLIDIVTCGECKWWDRDGDRPFGYCHAEKHCYFSTNWEISIYRTYKSDHFCSDGERRSE